MQPLAWSKDEEHITEDWLAHLFSTQHFQTCVLHPQCWFYTTSFTNTCELRDFNVQDWSCPLNLKDVAQSTFTAAFQILSPNVCVCVFAGTCVWSCAVSRRWTPAQWRAPCWEFTSRTPKLGRSSWLFHRTPNNFYSPPSLCIQKQSSRLRVGLQPTSQKKHKTNSRKQCRIQANSGAHLDTLKTDTF